MLSTIGRAAIRRIGGGSASTNRALQSLWALQRADYAQNQTPRCYATATKTDVKPKAKKATPAKAKTATKAKPAAKKAVVKKKPAPKKKAVLKKKPAIKKKPVLKKKKAKVPATEEEKLKAELKVLKTTALLAEEPTGHPTTAWVVMSSELLKGGGGKAVLKEAMPAIAAKYKALSPEELEAYNHQANQNKIANATAHRQWVESHTPDAIRIANNARKLLRKRTNTLKYRSIQDDRQPKRPTSALMFFLKSRYASGDLKGVGDLPTISKLLMKEWSELSAGEKSQYEEKAAADTERYVQEFKTVFKRDSKSKIAA